jgi:hypothetical protein
VPLGPNRTTGVLGTKLLKPCHCHPADDLTPFRRAFRAVCLGDGNALDWPRILFLRMGAVQRSVAYAMTVNFLAVLISFFALAVARAEVHTWSFIQDGNLQSTQSPGALSFKQGGRFEGDFIRLTGTNDIIILGRIDGCEYSVGLTNLCEDDRDYVLQVKGSGR